jgi:hypothetical protein
MIHIMFSEYDDIAFRYEGLARTVFDCKKFGGPKRIASQDFYENFVPVPNDLAVFALRAIIKKLIKKTQNSLKAELKIVLDSITEDIDQETAANLIDYVIKLCQDEEL